MKEPDPGDSPEPVGPMRGTGASQESQAGRQGAGRTAARKPEHASAATTSPMPPAGRASPAAPHGKRRRKRRRSRKVFAKDGAQTAKPNGQGGRAEMRAPASGKPPQVHQKDSRAAQGAPAAVERAAGQSPAQHSGPLPVYAALDLGTNNCRLLIAVPGRPGQFRVVDAFSRIVRLGEGLSSTGRLGDAAMDRAVEALRVCADKLAARDIRRARLVATEACRSAANGEEFLARVESRTGLKLEIINRETEARLAVSGCGSLVERSTNALVLFDIGGGSSEIALIDVSGERRARLARHIVAWTSLPVGVVSLAERFGGKTVTPEIFEAMVLDVAGMLERFDDRGKLGALASGPGFHLLGTSGTVTTLAGVHLGLERYDRRRVDGLWLDNADVDAMMNKLVSWTFQQRVANACIGPDRADLVLAGCAILEAIRRVWPSERLRVADRGLREGILSELMGEDGAWRRNNLRGARQ